MYVRAEFGESEDYAGALLLDHFPVALPRAELPRNEGDDSARAGSERIYVPLKKACATPFLTGVSDQKELLRVIRIAEDVSFSDEFLDSKEGVLVLNRPLPGYVRR